MADVLDTIEVQGQGCDLQNESTDVAGPQDLNSSDVTEDILQQALNEASAAQITDQLQHQEEATDAQEQTLLQADHHNDDTQQDLEGVDNSQTLQMIQNGSDSVARDNNTNSSVIVSQHSNTPESITINTLSAGDLSPAAPLGSKNNPIRIVQQGSTYTSTQHLSQDQITQIVQVLQRQNIAARSLDGEPTAVFNPQTKTRIVYRVVQPHAGAKNDTAPAKSQSSQLTARAYHEAKYGPLEKKKRGPGRPRKRARRESEDSGQSDSEDEDPAYVASDSDGGEGDMSHIGQEELTPAQKLQKKRQKPITRSGRKSKPPAHLAKDYKAIHRVDWYEDYDDDDGGYSDIYLSDEENNPQNSEISRRKFGCKQCSKAYIGPKGLARHYTNTGHGIPEDVLPPEENQTPAESTGKVDDDTTGITDITGDSSAGILNQEAHLSTPVAQTPAETLTPAISSIPSRGRGRGRGRPPKRPIDDDLWRPPPHIKTNEPKRKPGRPPKHRPEDAARGSGRGRGSSTPVGSTGRGRGRPPQSDSKARRIERLQSHLATYSCTEVLQSIMPRLREENVTLYDVLDCGLAGAYGERPSYTRMLQLYTELQGKMTEMAQICLRSITEHEQVAEDKEAIQITTAAIANSIGVEPGLFEVSDLPESDKHPEMTSSVVQDAGATAASADVLIDDEKQAAADKTVPQPTQVQQEHMDTTSEQTGESEVAQPAVAVAPEQANQSKISTLYEEAQPDPTHLVNTTVAENVSQPASTVLQPSTDIITTQAANQMTVTSAQGQIDDQSETGHMIDQSATGHMIDQSTASHMVDQSAASHMIDQSAASHMIDQSTGAGQVVDQSAASHMIDQSTAEGQVVDQSATGHMVDQSAPDHMIEQSAALQADADLIAQRRATLAEAVSKILPGDIIQLDGQNIVIPEGANIVQTADGIVIYQSSDPDAASVLNIKL